MNTNVLVIMVDDLDEHSFNQLLTGGKLPNIQTHLVNKGMRFTNSYVADVACCPSRATFFTGQYSHNHGVRNVAGSNGGYQAFHSCSAGSCSNPGRPTLATWLSGQPTDYYTGLIGKYMNGYASYYNQPPSGWDYWAALQTPGNGLDLRPGNYTVYTNQPNGIINPQNPPVYQTKYMGDQGSAFLNKWSTSGHNNFFLVLAPVAPHVLGSSSSNNYIPGQPHPQFTKRVYADRSGWNGYCDQFGGQLCAAGSLREGGNPNGDVPLSGYDLPGLAKPSFNTANCSETTGNKPTWICDNWADLNQNGNLANLRRLHLDRLESMISVDRMVGEMITELTNRGQLNNTLIIFTSDNGFQLGEFRLGNKQHPYEESIRVPLIIRKPGQTDALPDNTKLVVNIDWASTILDYAGLSWSDLTYNVDGRSLKPLLDQQSPNWRKRFLIEHQYPRDFNSPTGEGWLWDIPDYAAVCTEVATGVIGKNQLYVEYYQPFSESSGNVQYVEHYHMDTDPYQTVNQRKNATYDRTRVHLSAVLNELRLCAGQGCRNVENEASPAAVADNNCQLVDAVTIKNMYNTSGNLIYFRQHVYAGGNVWYRDSDGISHTWGDWRMLSNAETWGEQVNHPPVRQLHAAETRDWYDGSGNPTSARQIFYKKDGGPGGVDVWYRQFANPQIPWYITSWSTSALNHSTTPWLSGSNKPDAAAFRPIFDGSGSITNIRQFFYSNASPTGTYYYRDSTDTWGTTWPTTWQTGSYNDWSGHTNPPPTDRLDAVSMPIISTDKKIRQLFYSGLNLWWRDSGANGAGFPTIWNVTTLENHFKKGWPLQPTYPRPPQSCALP